MNKKKIQVLDIVFVILFIAFAVVIFNQKASKTIESGSYHNLTIVVDEIEKFSADRLALNDLCVDFRRNNRIGEIRNITVGEVIDYPSGELKGVDDGRSLTDSYRSVHIDIESKSEIKDNGIYINGYRYLLGEYIVFKCGDVQLHAKLLSIE